MFQEAHLNGSTTLSPATVAQLRALLESLDAESARSDARGSTWQILPDISAARRLSGQVIRRLVGSARTRRGQQPVPIAHLAALPAMAATAGVATATPRTTARVTPGSLRQVLIPDPAPRPKAPASSRVRSLRAAQRGTAA